MTRDPFHPRPPRAVVGWTLLELLIALAVAGILAALANAGYSAAVEKARVTQAMADIAELSMGIERHLTRQGAYPASLTEIESPARLDPWGNPYRYAPFVTPAAIAAARKDRLLNPLNRDYDLFSVGRDGKFTTQITQRDSLDDVIRARMGGYIGLAGDF